MGTLPELAVLGADKRYISALRRQTTGSPVVRNVTTDPTATLHSPAGTDALASIASHASKDHVGITRRGCGTTFSTSSAGFSRSTAPSPQEVHYASSSKTATIRNTGSISNAS